MSHDTVTVRPAAAYAALARKAGHASARIRYSAGRASRSVSSWMTTAIFVRADQCCRL